MIIMEKNMTRLYHRKNRIVDEKGFTLLEVLFAMAIATFGFLCLALMQGVSAHGNVTGSRFTQATFLAQQQIELVKSRFYGSINLADFPEGTTLSDVSEANLDETGAAVAGGMFTRRTIIQSSTEFSRLATVTVTWNAPGWDSQLRAHNIILTTTTRGDGN